MAIFAGESLYTFLSGLGLVVLGRLGILGGGRHLDG